MVDSKLTIRRAERLFSFDLLLLSLCSSCLSASSGICQRRFFLLLLVFVSPSLEPSLLNLLWTLVCSPFLFLFWPDFVCDLFSYYPPHAGLDSPKYRHPSESSGSSGGAVVLQGEIEPDFQNDVSKFASCDPLQLVCPVCRSTIEFPGVINFKAEGVCGLRCPKPQCPGLVRAQPSPQRRRRNAPKTEREDDDAKEENKGCAFLPSLFSFILFRFLCFHLVLLV